MDQKATKEKGNQRVDSMKGEGKGYGDAVFSELSSSNYFYIQHGTSYTMNKALINEALIMMGCGSLAV